MRPDGAALLAVGMRRQIRNDASPAVQSIVRYVLRERRAVRMLDSTLRATAGTSIPDWFGVANAVRCGARLRAAGDPGGVLACARRENERRAVDWLRALLPHVPWATARFDFGATNARDGVAAVAGRWRACARLRRLSRELRERHGMLAAFRALELLCYYRRLGELLDESGARIAVMSSYTNPWGIALNLAARRRGIPVVHVMHGAPIVPLPALDYALAIVNDPDAARTLQGAGCGIARVVVRGARHRLRPIPAQPGQPARATICLSKEPRPEVVLACIDALLARGDVCRVTVRPHPANLWRGLRDAVGSTGRQRVAISAASLEDDLGGSGLVVAGNSSVHLEALIAGVPTVHVAALDGTPADALSFLRAGVVFGAAGSTLPAMSELLAFYAEPGWSERFGRFVNVHQDESDTDAELRDAFHEADVGGAQVSTRLVSAFKLAAAAAGVAYLVATGRLSLAPLRSVLADTGTLAYMAGLQVVLLLAGVFRWWLLLGAMDRRAHSFRSLLAFTWIGQFFGCFAPSAVATDAARLGYTSGSGEASTAVAATSLVVDRTCGIVGACLLALAFATPPRSRRCPWARRDSRRRRWHSSSPPCSWDGWCSGARRRLARCCAGCARRSPPRDRSRPRCSRRSASASLHMHSRSSASGSRCGSTPQRPSPWGRRSPSCRLGSLSRRCRSLPAASAPRTSPSSTSSRNEGSPAARRCSTPTSWCGSS